MRSFQSEQVNESLLQEHFNRLTQGAGSISTREQERISRTLALVPDTWHSVIDVGCGDGRVSSSLLKRGCRVVGIDWSSDSVARFPGEKHVCDIRAEWPISEMFDGAICCEVLEHLTPADAARVITQIRTHVRKGFLLTVPAREVLEENTVACCQCRRDYHVWSHIQRFDEFGDVDRMAGLPSHVRDLIAASGVRPSSTFTRIRRKLGFSPYDPSYLCPYCGAPLAQSMTPSVLIRCVNKVLTWAQYVCSPFRAPGGWFACRYEV